MTYSKNDYSFKNGLKPENAKKKTYKLQIFGIWTSLIDKLAMSPIQTKDDDMSSESD